MKTLLPGDPALDDPLYAQRNPFQTFLLTLSLVAAAPLLRGDAGSALLERELPELAVVLWGACLLVGSLLAVVGEFWRGRTWNGLVVERAGLALVGGMAGVYAWIVWRATGSTDEVRYLLAVQVAYAAACAARVVQITRRLRWIRQVRIRVGA